MSFVGSSKNWGEQSCARLCQIVMEANDGMAQQIIENRHDLLDLLSLEQLEAIDDFGLTLPYLAVQYDRPDMIRYLAKRGIDMKKPCDGMGFGNPMFYAINMGRSAVVDALHVSGCPVTDPCDKYMNLTPEYHAIRTDNPLMKEKITNIKNADLRAAMLFKRNYLRYKCQTAYKKKKASMIIIQKIARGFVVRSKKWKKLHGIQTTTTTTTTTSTALRTTDDDSAKGEEEEGDDGETEGDVEGVVEAGEGSEVLNENSSLLEGEGNSNTIEEEGTVTSKSG